MGIGDKVDVYFNGTGPYNGRISNFAGKTATVQMNAPSVPPMTITIDKQHLTAVASQHFELRLP